MSAALKIVASAEPLRIAVSGTDAESIVERAKEQGRNRVEHVEGYSAVQRSEPHAPATNG